MGLWSLPERAYLVNKSVSEAIAWKQSKLFEWKSELEGNTVTVRLLGVEIEKPSRPAKHCQNRVKRYTAQIAWLEERYKDIPKVDWSRHRIKLQDWESPWNLE